jgi:hypothetical protein
MAFQIVGDNTSNPLPFIQSGVPPNGKLSPVDNSLTTQLQAEQPAPVLPFLQSGVTPQGPMTTTINRYLSTYRYAEQPAPVPSWFSFGTPPTGPVPITVPIDTQPSTTLTFSSIAASTSPFRLLAGQYGIVVSATWNSGSVTLQVLSADNLTWVTALTAFSVNGYATVSVPNGIYRVNVATATAVFVSLQIVV